MRKTVFIMAIIQLKFKHFPFKRNEKECKHKLRRTNRDFKPKKISNTRGRLIWRV